MVMTRKDYELIAQAIKATRDMGTSFDDNAQTLDNLVAIISVSLTLDNPAFDQARFTKACS